MKDTYILGQHACHLTDWITVYSVTFLFHFTLTVCNMQTLCIANSIPCAPCASDPYSNSDII